jgi:hypothetical protein
MRIKRKFYNAGEENKSTNPVKSVLKAGIMGGAAGNEVLAKSKGIFWNDIKNGNYKSALKHSIYIPKKDRDAWDNGTYGK